MTDILKASENGGNYDSYNYIIPQNLSKRQVLKNMPLILGNILNSTEHLECDLTMKCRTNITLAKVAQMFTARRVTYKEYDKTNYPNIYTMLFSPSGYGKDRFLNDMNDLVFFYFNLWIKEQEEKYFQKCLRDVERTADELFPNEKDNVKRLAYIEAEKSKIRRWSIEISDGTKEGIRADYEALQNSIFGCIFVRIGELGLYIKTQRKNSEQAEFLVVLFEGYDGKIPAKCIKSNNVVAITKNIPINALLYTDYTLLSGELKEIFINLLSTGLGRRAIISFQDCSPLQYHESTLEQQKNTRNALKQYGEELYSIFQQVNPNACYELTSDSYFILKTYLKYLTDTHNETEDKLLRAEIKSRELKALKISCLYACLNHPKEYIIKPEDVQQAIHTVQWLSEDFEKCLSYKPKNKDKYDTFFDFLVKNTDKKFTKTKLVNNHHRDCGFARDWFRNNFDSIINVIKEMAILKGYMLTEVSVNKNTGMEYQLIKTNQELQDGILPLNEIIKENPVSPVNAL